MSWNFENGSVGNEKLGADPAMASSIVVTTFTDVGCLLVFVGLAAVLI
ncbi:MAG: hypothetical protein ACJ8LL_11525 [Candidatus Udaeobacter sp.]